MPLFLLYAWKWTQIKHALVDPLQLNPYDSVELPPKKLNKRFKSIFSHRKEALFLLKSWNKNGGHRTRFCGRAAETAHQMHFLRFLRQDWGEFQNGMYAEGRRKH